MGEIPTQHLEVMAESFRHDGLNWHHVVIRATLDGIADLRAALRAAEKAREEADAYAGRANARIADLGERLDATEAVLRDAEKARKEAERERDEAKQAHEGACLLVAKMHHAATGAVTGPIRGVVEDVADISARLAAAESRAARLEEKVRRIQSACGLPNPAEACRVVLAIAAEEGK